MYIKEVIKEVFKRGLNFSFRFYEFTLAYLFMVFSINIKDAVLASFWCSVCSIVIIYLNFKGKINFNTILFYSNYIYFFLIYLLTIFLASLASLASF